MEFDGLTNAYTLTPLTVSPTALLLDPRNPRLITESAQDREYTPHEIKSRELQDHVRATVCRKEHSVTRIIESIEEMGFIGGLHEMIVKDVGRKGPYLVIEGNRRTAALQHLLSRQSTLRPDVLESIKRIEVRQFNYRRNPLHTEESVIDVLLGSIHIEGPKEWGALEKAHYVQRSYLRAFGEHRALRYDKDTAKAVGSSFKMSPQAVHKCLRICRVYEQLQRAGLAVKPRHFTLIDLATSNRAVAVPYFELSAERCELADAGLERLAQLILVENPPIHNPRLFKIFVGVHEDGTELELSQVACGGESLEDTWAGICRRKRKRECRESLEDLRDSLNQLSVDGFQGTGGERALILGIKALVDQRLVPLARSER